MRKIFFGIALVAILAVAIGAYFFWPKNQEVPIKSQYAESPKDATYLIDGQAITLTNGTYATSTAPGSASETITRYFGNEATGDLNGDGIPDTGFILTQSSGGSGTFYYAVVAIKSKNGYRGTNAILLGDRIAPQTTEIKDGMLVVNYADRNPKDPMTAQPSVGVSKYLLVVHDSLVEAPAIASDIYPLYSGVSWKSMEATTSPDYGVVAVMESVPFANITNIAEKSTPFTAYYRDKLLHAGWAQDIKREAGGPGAQISVYTKGDQFVVVMFQSIFHVHPSDAPSQCPCDLQFSLMSGIITGSQ